MAFNLGQYFNPGSPVSQAMQQNNALQAQVNSGIPLSPQQREALSAFVNEGSGKGFNLGGMLGPERFASMSDADLFGNYLAVYQSRQDRSGDALTDFLLPMAAGALVGGAATGTMFPGTGAPGGAGAGASGGEFTGSFTGGATGSPGFSGAAMGSPGVSSAATTSAMAGTAMAPGFFPMETAGVESAPFTSSFNSSPFVSESMQPFTGSFTGTEMGSPGFSGGVTGSPGFTPPGFTPGPESGMFDWWTNADWKRRLQMMSLGATGLSTGMGLYNSMQMRKLAQEAMNAQPQVIDPMGYGPRAKYLTELDALRADPSKLTSMPGYKAGEQAVTRSLASQGYMGSGNMMQALQDYGGRAYDTEVARLTQLAGGTMPLSVSRPDVGASVGARSAGANLASAAMGSMGFGLRAWTELL